LKARNTTVVGHVDTPGGGQVWVDGNYLYVGHMNAPNGTSVVDISDPRSPRVIAKIEDMPTGWHSHKVRVANGTMVVNYERLSADADKSFAGGLGIYDVSNPAKPVLRTHWKTAGAGVHRFSFDGRYAYISPTVEGYTGRIVMILDLADPAKPQEVGRWWLPGQWTAGGEQPTFTDGRGPRCHHPLRLGDRLYVSYWQHGGAILDISDMSQPKLVGRLDTTAAFPHPTHTLLAVPQELKGRRVMLVADEDVDKRWPSAPAFLWIYDITNETAPVVISTFQVEGLDPDGAPQRPNTGCHQPSERFSGTIVPCAWFANGLRLLDVSDPFAPREVGSYLPDPPAGCERPSSNDVTIDDRGLIYLADRQSGVDILETSVW
jgi:hypothetical protein